MKMYQLYDINSGISLAFVEADFIFMKDGCTLLAKHGKNKVRGNHDVVATVPNSLIIVTKVSKTSKIIPQRVV